MIDLRPRLVMGASDYASEGRAFESLWNHPLKGAETQQVRGLFLKFQLTAGPGFIGNDHPVITRQGYLDWVPQRTNCLSNNSLRILQCIMFVKTKIIEFKMLLQIPKLNALPPTRRHHGHRHRNYPALPAGHRRRPCASGGGAPGSQVVGAPLPNVPRWQDSQGELLVQLKAAGQMNPYESEMGFGLLR